MKPEIQQLNSKYPELTKERLLEIILQQESLIQRMQERIGAIEQEIIRLRTQGLTPNVSHSAQFENASRPQTAQAVSYQTVSQQENENIVHIAVAETEDTFTKVMKAVFHTAWMAIALGIIIEIALILVVSIGGVPESFKPFLADLLQKTSWAFLVCIALTLATVALKFRVPVMGIVGFLAAPFAFVIARALHAGVRYAMGLQPATSDGTSPIVVASIKAVEYGLLGAALAFISKYAWGRAIAHIWVGSIIAVLFGGALFAYSLQAAAVAVPTLGHIAKGIGELIFPIGCALITFLAQALGGLLPKQRAS